MKELFLSLKPDYYEAILYGLKKYEYRKRFCNEETKCYLYLSGKEKKVVGILELGKPIRLDLTRNNYINHPDTIKRVDKYILNRDINAIPIKALSLFDKPITLNEIRETIPGFMPPQMYYILDNKLKLKTLLKNIPIKDIVITHNHNEIYYDNLALSISEIKKDLKLKKPNQLLINNN